MNAEVNNSAAKSMETAAVIEFSGQVLGDLQSGKLVLPMLPEVTLRVSDLASDPESSLGDLADLIITDVTLSSTLIKVSNSPLYRGTNPVDSVPMAISRLGFKLVKNLVSSLAMQQMFQASSPGVEDRLRELWAVNVDVAARCRVLAAKIPGIDEDEAMLAGLIHNIGTLPLLVKADEMPELLEDDYLLDSLVHDLGAVVGVAVLESWDFPPGLIAVVDQFSHFDRDSVGGPDLVDVVQVAGLQCHLDTHRQVRPEDFGAVPAFAKLGIQTDVDVVELDENSEEYAAALALFK